MSTIRRALLLRATYGVDYAETFSLVAKIGSVHILISLAASLGWPLFHLDVNNIFLHGDLDEVHGATFRVCCSREERSGLPPS